MSFKLIVHLLILVLPITTIAFARPYIGADIISDLPERIINQCGVVSGLLISAVIYLALQIAKTRAGWESDRSSMMKIIEGQNDAYEALAVSHAKLEGLIIAFQARS